MDTESSIAALAEALRADERVASALLFGSAARGQERPASDLDVALIARSAPDAQALQRERLDLMARLGAASGREVDLLVLDFAGPELALQAFGGRRVLFDRDRLRTASVLERVLLQYFDGEHHRRVRAAALDSRRAARRG